MSQELVIALIAALAAILASVGAQIIAAVVTARQEQRRIDWERERLAMELRSSRTSRFDDVKRVAFADFLHQSRELRDSDLELVFAKGDDYTMEEEAAHQAVYKIVERRAAEITLMSPNLLERVNAVMSLLNTMDYQGTTRDAAEFRLLAEEFDDQLMYLRAEMGRELGLEVREGKTIGV